MGGRHGRSQGNAALELDGQTVKRRRIKGHPHIGLTLAHQFRHRVGTGNRNGRLNTGEFPRKGDQQIRQKRDRKAFNHRDVDPPARDALQAGQQINGAFMGLVRRLQAPQQLNPRFRQGKAARMPLKQGNSQLRLEQPDLPADGRGCHIELARRGPHRTKRRNRDKMTVARGKM